MYLVKIVKNHNVLSILHYQYFENIIAGIADQSIFSEIDTSLIPKDYKSPKIYFASTNPEHNTADDFEFRYEDGMYIYAGTISVFDK
jgi:hypothetical protein